MPTRAVRLIAVLALVVLAGSTGSCSFKRYVANSVGNSLANGPDVFSTETDPDLVRDAVPFGLKTMESLLAIVPNNRNLLLAACRGFTQYAFAFVQADADEAEATDHERATELHDRALGLYVRARNYGLRGMELRYKGITAQLAMSPDVAVRRFAARDVPLVFWTAAAWGSAISLGKDHPKLVADLPAVRALIERAVALNEGFEAGSLHDAMIVLDALPPAMGGSPESAKRHFDRAIALSNGTRAGPYLTYAQAVSVMTQNRGEFHSLLEQALAVDTNRDSTQRLANLVTQRHARWLLAREDDYFLDSSPADTIPQEDAH